MITIIVSFILDNFVSNFISLKSLFYPLFSLLSLIIIYPFYKRQKYLKISFILGLFYDIVYTDTLILNAFLFLIQAYLLKRIFKKIEYNYISCLLISLLSIIFYRTSTYIILIIINYTSFNIINLIKAIYSSIIINLIYLSLFYLILNRKLIFKKT